MTYNAYGIKSSYDLVDQVLNVDIDIVFICEHWLKPSDLHIFKDKYCGMNCWTYFKSSVNPEVTTGGRPHGGVA